MVPDQQAELLREERQLGIGWFDHLLFANGLGESEFDRAVPVGSNRESTFADRQIGRMGRGDVG